MPLRILKNKKQTAVYFLASLVLINGLIWSAVFSRSDSQFLKVYFFDIGQGDAIFIEAKGGNQVLIDGGPSNLILSKLGETIAFYDHSIDLVVLTHPHADHVSGLIDVIKNYKIGMILMSNLSYHTAEYQEFLRLVKEKEIPIIFASGQKIYLNSETILEILSPIKDLEGAVLKNVHEGAIVSRLKYGKTSFLLNSDAEENLESWLADNYGNLLDSDVLKIGHHGSKTSSSEKFLATVSPEISVISAGRKNRYGHPHPLVLERLKKFGSRILRTDLDRDIELISNGDIIEIK